MYADAVESRARIENALRQTGMFSEIQYGAKGVSDSYHIEFSFHQSGISVEDSLARAQTTIP